MYESAIKGLESNHSDADIRKSSSSSNVSRVYVEGYDTSLCGYDFVLSTIEHFSSCGEVMHVYIPGYAQHTNLNRFALIYLRGEGAEEKALKLTKSDSRGHKLVVEAYPFHAKHLDHELAPTRDADNKRQQVIFVDGYDTSLPLEYVKSMLFEQLSLCGRVLSKALHESHPGVLSRHAWVKVEGIDTIENLVQLCGSDGEGWENIKLSRIPLLPLFRGTGHFCNENTETGVQYEICYAPKDPNLPKPWIGLVNSSTETNVTQYQRPPSSAPPS